MCADRKIQHTRFKKQETGTKFGDCTNYATGINNVTIPKSQQWHVCCLRFTMQKLVGPGTPRPPHAIQPQGVADFVEGAGADGLVLVAFGSTVQSITLTSKDLEELAKGFAALAPTRVLWAMSGLPDGLQLADLNLAPNTKVVSWVDYNDVLGHPHTRVFVSHCGVHSIYEAAFHGVPVIAVPFQFEQVGDVGRGLGGC